MTYSIDGPNCCHYEYKKMLHNYFQEQLEHNNQTDTIGSTDLNTTAWSIDAPGLYRFSLRVWSFFFENNDHFLILNQHQCKSVYEH